MINPNANLSPEDSFLEYIGNADEQSAEDVNAINSLSTHSFMERNDIEDIVSYVMYNHEKIGFINGYLCAMKKVGVV